MAGLLPIVMMLAYLCFKQARYFTQETLPVLVCTLMVAAQVLVLSLFDWDMPSVCDVL